MREDQASPAKAHRIAEDAARRLLARAIELDHSLGSGTSLDDLRQAAREAGISSQAFDIAAGEMSSPPAVLLQAVPERKDTLFKQVVINVVAAPLCWLLAAVVVHIPGWLHWRGRIDDVFGVLAWLAVFGLARWMRARVMEMALVGIAVSLVVFFGARIWFGDTGGYTKPLTWMVAETAAGIIGVCVGMWLTNRKAAHRDSQPQQTLLVLPQLTPTSEPAPSAVVIPPQSLEFGIS